MRALFARTGAADQPVGIATWDETGVTFDAGDESIREALVRIFRKTPVVVDDPALRTAGTSGPVALTPGTLAWFMAAARTRCEAGGLVVVLSPSGGGAVGWDPAGSYRTFERQVELIEGDESSAVG